MEDSVDELLIKQDVAKAKEQKKVIFEEPAVNWRGGKLATIYIKDIDPNSTNVRTNENGLPKNSTEYRNIMDRFYLFDPDFQDLCESIRNKGVMQPPHVARNPVGHRYPYRLIFGFRRAAAVQANHPPGDTHATINVVVHDAITDEEVIQLTENHHRKDMELLDLINAVGRLADEDQKQVEIAKELGITQPTVATYARFQKLLTAHPVLREHVRRGTLGADQLRALTDLIYRKTVKSTIKSNSQLSREAWEKLGWQTDELFSIVVKHIEQKAIDAEREAADQNKADPKAKKQPKVRTSDIRAVIKAVSKAVKELSDFNLELSVADAIQDSGIEVTTVGRQAISPREAIRRVQSITQEVLTQFTEAEIAELAQSLDRIETDIQQLSEAQ